MSSPEQTTTNDTKPKRDWSKYRDTVRVASAQHYSRMREMTKLEQAAWKERKLLGEKSPYTPDELKEAEAIRALQSELEGRASQLHHKVNHRLEREAERDEAKAALLSRFKGAKGVRLELPAF